MSPQTVSGGLSSRRTGCELKISLTVSQRYSSSSTVRPTLDVRGLSLMASKRLIMSWTTPSAMRKDATPQKADDLLQFMERMSVIYQLVADVVQKLGFSCLYILVLLMGRIKKEINSNMWSYISPELEGV